MKDEKHRFKLRWDGFVHEPYYFYWWNWLSKKQRYWGREDLYYDGPITTFGFWFFNWSWCMPWTTGEPPEETVGRKLMRIIGAFVLIAALLALFACARSSPPENKASAESIENAVTNAERRAGMEEK